MHRQFNQEKFIHAFRHNLLLLERAQKSNHTQLYKHFYIFGTDFSTKRNELDKYLEETISYMYLEQGDLFVSHLAELKDIKGKHIKNDTKV